ncbi:hypothetical protein PTTG_29524, partial [Puccinia triticina 1-1 BBBD Race 1]
FSFSIGTSPAIFLDIEPLIISHPSCHRLGQLTPPCSTSSNTTIRPWSPSSTLILSGGRSTSSARVSNPKSVLLLITHNTSGGNRLNLDFLAHIASMSIGLDRRLKHQHPKTTPQTYPCLDLKHYRPANPNLPSKSARNTSSNYPVNLPGSPSH